MVKKIVLFAFRGDPMCIVHVWLNALDMKAKEYEVKVVIEGSATELIKDYHENPETVFRNLYIKTKEAGLIAGVCKACAIKMGSLEAVNAEGLPTLSDMSGHPSISQYTEAGYEVITF